MNDTKLKEGDVINVHGFVMLQKLEQGQYRIARISERFKQKVYEFAKPKGKKIIVRHYANSVDGWIKTQDDENINKIVRETK